MEFGIPRQREELPFRKQIVVKAILFNEQGQILLLRKPPSEWREATKGYDLPGGKLEEKDEGNVNKALQREVSEETGLDIQRLTEEPTSIEEEVQAEKGRILRVFKYPCVMRSAKGKVNLSAEHEYFGWLMPEQLRSMKNYSKVSWLLISPERVSCPPKETVKDWIEKWKDVPDQMIKDIETAQQYWQEWMKCRQQLNQTGRER